MLSHTRHYYLTSFVLLSKLLTSSTAIPSIEFRAEDAKPKGNVLDLTFQSRVTIPYGPDLFSDPPQSPEDQPYRGYGVGMGAAESIMYDPTQKYLYSMSKEVGYILVVDYENPQQPKITPYSFATSDPALESIEICPEQGYFFVVLEDAATVEVFPLVQRDDPKQPTLLKSIPTGGAPKSVLPNTDCSLIAVSNENPGDGLSVASINIMEDFLSDDMKSTLIPMDFNAWDDRYVLERGLNMGLTLNALEYWDDHSHMADDLDFAELRANYRSAIFLEPERLAWNGPEETELLVNMQKNNGLLRINMTDYSPVAVAGYGLKDHNVVPVDLNDSDGDCILKTYPSVFAMRNPDGFQTLKYNDKFYVITANEGSGSGYEDWEEELDSTELFSVSHNSACIVTSQGCFLFCKAHIGCFVV